MAADPFTALGIASNVIQFVDFTWKLVIGSRTIYQSSEGASENNLVLRVILADVSRLSHKISTSGDDSSLDDLARECKTIATRLIELLQQLTVKGKRTKWRCFAVAMKEVWSKAEIDELSSRLARLQNQLTLNLQWLVVNRVSQMARSIRDIQDTCLSLDLKRREDIGDLKGDVLRAVSALLPNDSLEVGVLSVPRIPDQNDLDDLSGKLQDLSITVKALETEGSKAAEVVRLLKSLYFTDLAVRHGRIEDAYSKTFTWIYQKTTPDSQPVNFVEWLRTQTGIYWIQGKPGSGKSTLMKFICDHPQTRDHLRFWADSSSKQVVIAKFFLWISGSRLQKSQEGLLRGLLFEILRECPELTPHVLATRDKLQPRYDLDATDSSLLSWTDAELLAVFEKIATQNMSTRFCFFIDALDEYHEERKTHDKLIQCLHELSKSENIKLCVSSRPWTVFMDSYGDSPWLLKLEDLTRNDIHQYVTEMLGQNKQFRRLNARDRGYQCLVEEVVQKAQGVFLWVFLVVRELLEGLNYSDSVKLMQQRLNQFPEDLDGFFRRMVESIPKVYRLKTARTFRIATSFNQPLLLMTYAHLDDVEEDPGLSFSLPTKPLDPEEIEFKVDKMRRQIDGRCKGLLEVVDYRELAGTQPRLGAAYYQFKVDFLHRTVRDFLTRSKDISSYLNEDGEEDSETWELCCRAFVAQIKACPPSLDKPRCFLDDLFFFAYLASGGSHNSEVINRLLDEADASYTITRSKLSLAGCHNDKSVTVGLACQTGFLEFVQRRVTGPSDLAYNSIERMGPPILSQALSPPWRHFGSIKRLFPNIIEYLLTCGADPNEFYNRSTPFLVFIAWLDNYTELQDQPSVTKIIESLLRHGANIAANDLTASTRVQGILDRCCHSLGYDNGQPRPRALPQTPPPRPPATHFGPTIFSRESEFATASEHTPVRTRVPPSQLSTTSHQQDRFEVESLPRTMPRIRSHAEFSSDSDDWGLIHAPRLHRANIRRPLPQSYSSLATAPNPSLNWGMSSALTSDTPPKPAATPEQNHKRSKYLETVLGAP